MLQKIQKDPRKHFLQLYVVISLSINSDEQPMQTVQILEIYAQQERLLSTTLFSGIKVLTLAREITISSEYCRTK